MNRFRALGAGLFMLGVGLGIGIGIRDLLPKPAEAMSPYATQIIKEYVLAQGAPGGGGGTSVSGTTGTFSGEISGTTVTASGGFVSTQAINTTTLTGPDGNTLGVGQGGATGWTFNNHLNTTTNAAFKSGASSGANAFQVNTSGARFDFGAGASDYASSDGSTVTFASAIATSQVKSSYIQAAGSDALDLGGAKANGATAIGVRIANSTSLTTAGAQIAGFYSGNFSGQVAAIDKDGSYLIIGNPTLRTCAAGIEGLISRDVLSGVSTGKRTKLCLCTSDGAATYVWQNLATGTLGSTTACGTE